MYNEITVRLKCSIEEIKTILEDKGFKVNDKYKIEDTYYISNDIDITKLSIREILKSYILLRDITQYKQNDFNNSYNIVKITYKHKNIAINGEIINQEKCDCEIKDKEQGKNILKAIGYKEIMKITEQDIVYSKDELKIEIKDIENGDNLIEIETLDSNEEINTIEKLKQKIERLDIPIDKSNFFVKKAEIELKRVLEI